MQVPNWKDELNRLRQGSGEEMVPGGQHKVWHTRAGDVVWNPLTGEKALLVESAEESAGARIVVDTPNRTAQAGVEAGGRRALPPC